MSDTVSSRVFRGTEASAMLPIGASGNTRSDERINPLSPSTWPVSTRTAMFDDLFIYLSVCLSVNHCLCGQ